MTTTQRRCQTADKRREQNSRNLSGQGLGNTPEALAFRAEAETQSGTGKWRPPLAARIIGSVRLGLTQPADRLTG